MKHEHTIQVRVRFVAEVTDEHAVWLVREAVGAHPEAGNRFTVVGVLPEGEPWPKRRVIQAVRE